MMVEVKDGSTRTVRMLLSASIEFEIIDTGGTSEAEGYVQATLSRRVI